MLKMVTVRSVIAMVAAQNSHVYQMDVYNAFLQGDLQEEVYMELSQGVNIPTTCDQVEIVCNLLKLLYGLKQASRQ